MAGLNLCAVDLGNTSGRVMRAAYDGAALTLEEVHRFANGTVPMNGFLKLEFVHLLRETILGIAAVGEARSIGIDSWAVDFGLLDSDDDLILTPHHHRDGRTQKAMDRFPTVATQLPWYLTTGATFRPINTSMQLMSMVMDQRAVLDHAKSFLMIPDLISFYLTGVKSNESTNASTTQMVSLDTLDWDARIVEEIGIDPTILQPIETPGRSMGRLRPAIKKSFSVGSNPEVVLVGSHDTASAVHATPFSDGDSAFLSSGTWSLFGTVRTSPVLTEEALRLEYNHERATDGRIRLLCNSAGMWLLEELLRLWAIQDGTRIEYGELFTAAANEPPFAAFLDPRLPRFFNPDNMVAEVDRFFRETGQSNVTSRGGIVRTVLEGLAFAYRQALERLERVTGSRMATINVVGGGARNELLNTFVAAACNRPVVAGPIEAAALGNVLTQLEYLGEITGQEDRSALLRASFAIAEFEPHEHDRWSSAHESFSHIAFAAGHD